MRSVIAWLLAAGILVIAWLLGAAIWASIGAASGITMAAAFGAVGVSWSHAAAGASGSLAALFLLSLMKGNK